MSQTSFTILRSSYSVRSMRWRGSTSCGNSNMLDRSVSLHRAGVWWAFKIKKLANLPRPVMWHIIELQADLCNRYSQRESTHQISHVPRKGLPVLKQSNDVQSIVQ